MNRWRWAGAFVVVVAAVVGVSAYASQGSGDRPVWKGFDGEKPFWQEMTTKTVQTMKVQDMEVIQTQKQTFWVKWTPKGASDKKGTKVEYEIVGVAMDIQIGGNNIAFDSRVKDPPNNPLTDFFKALVGSKFTMTVDTDPKDGTRVTAVEGVTLFINKLAQANEQLKPLLASILKEEAIKDMSNPTFAAYPKTDEDWKKGVWTSDIDLNMGPIGSYKTKYTYTLNKSDKNKIDVEAKMNYKAPDSKDAANLPFTIKSGKLEAEKANGEIILDAGKNNIKSSSMTMTLKGELTIDIAGMETRVSLNQTQVSTLSTTYEDPLPKSK